MKAIDMTVLDRHREAVERIKREQEQAREQEQQAARKQAIEDETTEFMRLQSVFGLPTDPAHAAQLAEKTVKGVTQ